MCRLSAITSGEYFSVMENIMALETMKEGHDGSGLGVTLKDLGGEFEQLKEYPIFSGICTDAGRKKIRIIFGQKFCLALRQRISRIFL